MDYSTMKKELQAELNNFPMMFAFSEAQFTEGMEKLGVTSPDELQGIGGSGAIRKSDSKKFTDMLISQGRKLEQALEDPEFLYGAIRYELNNHEYCITGDASDALTALGITMAYINETPERRAAFDKAELETRYEI